MNVVRHEARVVVRQCEAILDRERLADVVESCGPVITHRRQTELIVLVMMLVGLLLIDQVLDVVLLAA